MLKRVFSLCLTAIVALTAFAQYDFPDDYLDGVQDPYRQGYVYKNKYGRGPAGPTVVKEPKKDRWAVSVQGGYSFAFGDDSWNIKDDYKCAKGTSVSFSVGYNVSRVFTPRIKARYQHLYSRVNLEVYEAYYNKYPSYFPREGFYGYHSLALQAEAMFNLSNLATGRWRNFLNVYLIAGAGCNGMFGYDHEVLKNWDGTYEGIEYDVDTRTHIMPLGTVGGMVDIRVNDDLSFNVELLGTFTGDLMEGVKYEEPYDVYVTIAFGATLHF